MLLLYEFSKVLGHTIKLSPKATANQASTHANMVGKGLAMDWKRKGGKIWNGREGGCL